jgi:hypothetical protein
MLTITPPMRTENSYNYYYSKLAQKKIIFTDDVQMQLNLVFFYPKCLVYNLSLK